jgi:hypothetical protein
MSASFLGEVMTIAELRVVQNGLTEAATWADLVPHDVGSYAWNNGYKHGAKARFASQEEKRTVEKLENIAIPCP